MRDMIIAALQNSKLFIITDNQERADATLRGSSDDKIFTEEHNSSESIGLHATSGTGSSDRTIRWAAALHPTRTPARESRTARRAISRSGVTKRRLPFGWSISTETLSGRRRRKAAGGKFRGAMADVADKIARQLVGRYAQSTRRRQDVRRRPRVPASGQPPGKDAAVAACP